MIMFFCNNVPECMAKPTKLPTAPSKDSDQTRLFSRLHRVFKLAILMMKLQILSYQFSVNGDFTQSVMI